MTLFLFSGALLNLLIFGGTNETSVPFPGLSYPVGLVARWGRWFTYGFVIFLVAVRPRVVLSPLIRNPLILGVVAVAVLSAAWSTEDLGYQIRLTSQLVVVTLFGTYLAGRYRTDELLRFLAILFGLIAALSVLFILVFPEYGIRADIQEGPWRGVFRQKNQLGLAALLGGLLFGIIAWRGPGRRRLAALGAVVSIGLLIGSQSVTSLLVMASLWVLLPAAVAVRRSRRKAVALLVALCAVWSGLLIVMGQREAILFSLGRDVTLTGRTQIWTAVWEQIQERPVLGYGYRAFWRPLAGPDDVVGAPTERVLAAVGWETPHSHNGFLDLWVDLGLVGLVFFLGAYLVGLSRAWRRLLERSDAPGLWHLAFLITLALRNLTETSFYNNALVWALMVAAMVVPFTDGGSETSRAW
ncbi:O-antigen ligase family protein [Gemmatimonadota bacterium]